MLFEVVVIGLEDRAEVISYSAIIIVGCQNMVELIITIVTERL